MSHKIKTPLGETKGSKKILSDSYRCVPNERNGYTLSEENYFSKSNLLSKNSLDTVECINGKTSAETEVLLKLRECAPESRYDTNSHIVAHGRISRNQEIIMNEQRFFQIPKSLSEDPRWKGMRLKYQKVLIILLEHCCYYEQKFNINGILIQLAKGQICASYRQLMDWCNDGVSFKQDLIDKNIVERAVSLFFKIQIARHEVRHGKSIITITLPGYYEERKNQSETPSETRVRHDRDINEESEERKEDIAIRSDSDMGVVGGIAAAESPFSNLKKKRKVTEEDFLIVKEMCYFWPEILERTMKIWLSKYSPTYIGMQLDEMGKREKIDNAEKWMEKALIKNYAQDKKNIEKNMEFIERFKEENRWCKIEILKQYCNLHMPGGSIQDYSFSLDPELFKIMIEQKFETMKEIQ